MITSCETKKSNIEKAKQYTESIEMISDSLKKIKAYKVDLLICSYSSDSKYGKLTFQSPSEPYFISTPFYDYKRINGIDILFIDYPETEKLSELEKETFLNEEVTGDNYNKIKHLIENGKVTFGKKLTNYPFYKFIFCKKNKNIITCFDNIMESKAYKESKVYNENIFYPDCG